MKQRLSCFLVALALALSVPAASFARVERDVIAITLTSSAVTTFTVTTTLNSRKISFQADSANAATAYVGDATLDATSATTLKTSAHASLDAGSGWTPAASEYAAERGHAYQLSTFRASGTTGDIVRLTYEVITP